jgi:hypothetical protein
MNTYPYLRAFLAGAFTPVIVLPLALAMFVVLRLVLRVPFPIERGIIFPMALVPSFFGLWNMLWMGSHERTHLPIGIHGALLPFLLMPCGAMLATCLGILAIGPHGVEWFQVLHLPYTIIASGFLAALGAYYLVWKYLVAFVNRALGIS